MVVNLFAMPGRPNFLEKAPRLYPTRYWKPRKLLREVFGNFNFLHGKWVHVGHSLPQGAGCPAAGRVPQHVHGRAVGSLAREAHLCPQQHVPGAVPENSRMSDLPPEERGAVKGKATPLTLLFFLRDFPLQNPERLWETFDFDFLHSWPIMEVSAHSESTAQSQGRQQVGLKAGLEKFLRGAQRKQAWRQRKGPARRHPSGDREGLNTTRFPATRLPRKCWCRSKPGWSWQRT